MNGWLLFLHIGSVLAFMLVHGVQVTVTWKMRREPDPTRMVQLFDALPSTLPLRWAVLAIFITGLALVAFLNLWLAPWIWLSLGTLAGIWLTMYRWGGEYYTLIENTVLPLMAATDEIAVAENRAAFDRARLSWRVPAMTIVGIGGVAVILWLMVFRPG
jgi:hypothetical protein